VSNTGSRSDTLREASTSTVRLRSLRDHTFKKSIKFSILVREGVWGFIFEFEGTSGGPCRELIVEFESPPVNAACALLLLFVMAEAVGLQGVHTGALGAHFDFTLKTTINS